MLLTACKREVSPWTLRSRPQVARILLTPRPISGKMTPQSTETEWRAKLGAEGFRVMRENGTEAPFSGTYCDAMPSGDYYCRGKR